MSLKKSMLCGALLISAAFVLLLSFSSSATARPMAACVWPDTTTGSWLDAGTWSCGAVPGPADDVSVGLGSTIHLTTSATANNLTLTGGQVLDVIARDPATNGSEGALPQLIVVNHETVAACT